MPAGQPQYPRSASGPANGAWINNLYQVAVFRLPTPVDSPSLIHLSIKRRDKQAIHDWRHLQQIKNRIVGPEHEAIEIYPAESRLVDTSNQYHLFVFDKPDMRLPVGFCTRWVSNTTELGSVQRPFPLHEMPKDCMTTAEYMRKHLSKPETAPVETTIK